MKAEIREKESGNYSKMASSCCGTKKQRMDGELCIHNNQYGKMNGHSLTNGQSNNLTNGHGTSNGYSLVEQVSSHDMCFYCFEVLYRELHRLDGPTPPNFTDEP